jgi:hypothetical protein
MPQRRYEPTEADRAGLLALLGAAVPLSKISSVLGISEDTIRRHYPRELAGSGLTRGRKPFDPSPEQREMVRGLAAVGVSHDDIAEALRISPTTLRRHCRQELWAGTLRAGLKVGANLLRIATTDPPVPGTVEAAIWWTKARMGWKDPSPRPPPSAWADRSAVTVIITPREDGQGMPERPLDGSAGDRLVFGWPSHGDATEAGTDA